MASSTQRCPFPAASSCPFLRTVSVAAIPGTSSASGDADAERLVSRDSRSPIFSEGMDFQLAFKAFHGDAGVMPLPQTVDGKAKSSITEPPHQQVTSCPFMKSSSSVKAHAEDGETFAAALSAAPLATIGLSGFGGGGFFGFDAFKDAMQARRQKQQRADQDEQRKRREEQQQDRADGQGAESKPHEAGDDWLATGNCPIAKSYRAFNRIVPAMAAAFKPPAGVTYVCPPVIVAMRAELAKHPAMKTLRPQALPIKVLAIGTMGLFLNIPLGAWREHLVKFSPQWILVVHASVPFVAMLRKAALIPKYAMAFTIAASIVGQAIGARMERKRISVAPTAVACDGDLSSSEGLKVTKRKASRRELGRGLRGLGVRSAEPMVAYDCEIEAAPVSSQQHGSHPAHGQLQYSGMKQAPEMVTAAA